MKCPCSSNKIYDDCCKIAHQNALMVETAEQLMRSRYSAFVLGLGEYLVNTHHPLTREGITAKELTSYGKSIKWKKLEIIKTEKGSKNDFDGLVEFKAFYKNGACTSYQHELSIFERLNGQWYYLEAK